jgi:hypothetical protein
LHASQQVNTLVDLFASCPYNPCKMHTFDQWLEAKLAERGWRASDLTAASRDDELPRGLDPGLISRWRRPPPLGVVPNQAKTLTRLARALGVPESEVYAAAGVQLPAVNVDTERDEHHPRLASFMAQIEAAFHALTEQEWAVREEAGRALFSVPSVRATTHPSRPATTQRGRGSRSSNQGDSGSHDSTQTRYAGLWGTVAAVAPSS